MKRKIIISAAIAACLTLCAAVWPQCTVVKQIPEPSPTPTAAAPQPALPGPKELAIPMITEKETVKEPETELAQEAPTEEIPELTPVEEKQTEEEPKPASEPVPAQEATVRAGDMVYVDGFGWLESQGEGTVIYDEMMYENGNKVGSMG